ncbi:MAG: acyltransferase [Cytophagaceae bacterium]|nr:acyltransferase [Cytophagaceae bacterium]
MKNIKQKLAADPSGYVWNFLRWRRIILNQKVSSLRMRALLALKGIPVGKKSCFYGNAYFVRCPQSAIIVGNGCTFDSSKFKNLIGVNRSCTVSTLNSGAELRIGNATGFSGVKIGCAQKITIGNNCLFGANVLVTDSDWHAIDPLHRSNPDFISTAPVEIGNNVFIGVNSVILKGSHIGNNSVIGAGSVVSGTIPANVIAAGNPCRVIRELKTGN